MGSRLLTRTRVTGVFLLASSCLASCLEFGRSTPFSWLTVCEVGATEPSPKAPAKQPTSPTQDASPKAASPAEAPSPGVSNEERLEQKLREVTTVEFEEMPLSDVVEYLNKAHKVEIQLDAKALEEVGVDTMPPVTIKLKKVMLKSALRHILRPLELAYTTQDGVLLITTPEVAEARLRTRVYSVRNLVSPDLSKEKIRNPYNRYPYGTELIQIITSSISPNSWDDVGGPGSILCNRELLVIRQTDEVLEACEALLAELKRLPLADEADKGNTKLMERIPVGASSDSKLMESLKKAASLHFEATPLMDVSNYIESEYKIELLIDTKALNELGVELDNPISFSCESYPLSTALRMLLQSVDLKFIVQDEALLITTPEQAEARSSLVIYPVADLLVLPVGAEQVDIENEMESLMALFVRTVAPESWDEVGGDGVIKPFTTRKVIVISTTAEVHSEVETLIAKIRKMRSEEPSLPDSSRVNLDEMRIVVYELQYPELAKQEEKPATQQPEQINTEKIALLIPRLLGKEVWQQNDEVLIEGLSNRLIVKQTLRVHRKIEVLLSQMGVTFFPHNAQIVPTYGVQPRGSAGDGLFNLPAK